MEWTKDVLAHIISSNVRKLFQQSMCTVFVYIVSQNIIWAMDKLRCADYYLASDSITL